MSARIVRIELRRSSARWAGVLVLGIALAFLGVFINSGPMWHGPVAWNAQWGMLAIWTRFLLVMLWPVAIGAGAVLGRRDSRSGMTELLATTARPVRERVAAPAGAMAFALAAGYFGLLLAGAVQVILNDGFVSFGWVPIALVGFVALIGGGWLGMALGRTLPSAFTAPIATVVSFIGAVTLWSAGAAGSVGDGAVPTQVALLAPSLAEPRDPWQTISAAVTLGQAAWLTGLAATGLLLLAASSARFRLLAVLPAVAGLALALAVFPSRGEDTVVVDTAAAELTCAGNVCVTRLHESKLATLTAPGQEALRKLSSLPGTPARIEEVPAVLRDWGENPPPQPRSASAVLVNFQLREFDGSTGGDLTRSLVAGAGTPSCTTERSTDEAVVRDLAARTVAAAWFMGDLKPLAGAYSQSPTGAERSAATAALSTQVWDALRALPLPEQQTRITALRTAALSCSGDLVDALAQVNPR